MSDIDVANAISHAGHEVAEAVHEQNRVLERKVNALERIAAVGERLVKRMDDDDAKDEAAR